MKDNKRTKKTYIGGQAVMEGIMMRGKSSMATAVRDPEGVIQIESERITLSEKQRRARKIPFVRGVLNFISSLVDGNRVLMRSADVAFPEEDQPSKAEKWLENHKMSLSGIWNFLSTIVGVVLALLIFIALPQYLTGFLPFKKTSPGIDGLWFNLIEGGIRLLIFVLYITLISFIPSLKRVFMCHGAEHKTITCYEEGKELTIENVRECSRVHDRYNTNSDWVRGGRFSTCTKRK